MDYKFDEKITQKQAGRFQNDKCWLCFKAVSRLVNLQTSTVSQSSAWLMRGLISAERIFWSYSLYWIFNMLSLKVALLLMAAGSEI